MMGDEKVEKIKEILWKDCQDDPDAQVYMILDSARDKEIFIGLMNSEEEYVCLYKGGKKAKGLDTCAPYLVRLEKESSFTEWILKEGWGQSWGVFCRTTQPIEKVRDHFREFLMVVNDDGDPMYFRFYDPRVMSVYLPSCDREQLNTVLGSLDKYMMENEEGMSLIEYSMLNDVVSDHVVVLEESV